MKLREVNKIAFIINRKYFREEIFYLKKRSLFFRR